MTNRRVVPDDTPLPARAEDLLRELAPQVLGALVRRFGDFDTAEDALQEAMLAAATQWPVDGLPDNPRGWLIQVAQRRMADTVRAEVARRRRETTAFDRDVPDAMPVDYDDTLAMFFLCCHPALSSASAIALTLRAVGGLTTAEIAHAFLLPEATMAQRITRAKKKLATLERPFARPGDVPPGRSEATRDSAERRARLGTVLHVLYLIFNEGSTSTSGPDLQRADVSAEAIRLARAVHRMLPDDTEVTGLLALMLLTDARRAARTGSRGELIPLAEQNRARWDREQITEGVTLTTSTLAQGLTGPYQIQAAIAVLHAQAISTEDTDWTKILALYDLLEKLSDNPIVTLNRAVAVAMVHGPEAGLELAATLDDQLAGNHRLDAVRGHLHEMAGDFDAAITCYTTAAGRTPSAPENHYLTVRAAQLRHR
ncbi:RNA polymerase sigma factor [Nocardia sp. NPDC050175]|uniref:RNA polymerase sigma factor n=1 Tax=Nocardia sp. NPDC050175 TaxID=3364317 RepID=UPI00378C8B44